MSRSSRLSSRCDRRVSLAIQSVRRFLSALRYFRIELAHSHEMNTPDSSNSPSSGLVRCVDSRSCSRVTSPASIHTQQLPRPCRQLHCIDRNLVHMDVGGWRQVRLRAGGKCETGPQPHLEHGGNNSEVDFAETAQVGPEHRAYATVAPEPESPIAFLADHEVGRRRRRRRPTPTTAGRRHQPGKQAARPSPPRPPNPALVHCFRASQGAEPCRLVETVHEAATDDHLS